MGVDNDTIFTLNARGNIYLEVFRDYCGVSSQKMHVFLRNFFREMLQVLAVKGIKYHELKTALVPSVEKDKHEVAFLFDSQKIDSCMYGCEAMRQVLPLLDARSNHSVLCGDLIGVNNDQEFISEMLRTQLIAEREFSFVHSNFIYCIYLNNISEKSFFNINQNLKNFPGYIGYVPTTFASAAKTYLSLILCNSFVKKGKIVILAHEDDRPDEENVNITSYPFHEYGCEIRSIKGLYFSHFLSYKIEREVSSGFKSDSDFSLNALSSDIQNLSDMQIEIAEDKFSYLKREKADKFKKAGIYSLTIDELTSLIREKLYANYIYNLRYLSEHHVMIFNIIIEVNRLDGGHPTRLNLSLEYNPNKRHIRVITLY
jgi:hypothetical protein